MNESLVQWTLLHNLDFLSKTLDFPIARKIGQEISTEFGRIDFVVEDTMMNQLIVELETILDNKAKLDYCFNQILNYKNFRLSEETQYCILYASETNRKNEKTVYRFARENDVLVREYSLNEVKNLYTSTIERLSLSLGMSLPQPRNYTICYLRWLNKIMKPFKDQSKDTLTIDEISANFTSYKTTNFRCYRRLALDFEMFSVDGEYFNITGYGKEFISNFNPSILFATKTNIPSIDLSNEQKRLLLKILTNGNWTIHKVNLYWFLRFIEVTSGDWIPKQLKYFEQAKLDLVNGLFGVNYRKRTMYEILNFTCNFCLELGLVERITSTTNYDKVYLTPLGIEVNNIFSFDLQIKKSRLNLNFKYLE